MKPRIVGILAGALLNLAASPAFAQSSKDWVDVNDPNELRALYSNKTFRGNDRGNDFVGHFRADGRGILIVRGGKPARRLWEVKGNDQMCVTPEIGAPRCFRYQRNSKNPNQVVATNVTDGVKINFTVEDGIPQF